SPTRDGLEQPPARGVQHVEITAGDDHAPRLLVDRYLVPGIGPAGDRTEEASTPGIDHANHTVTSSGEAIARDKRATAALVDGQPLECGANAHGAHDRAGPCIERAHLPYLSRCAKPDVIADEDAPGRCVECKLGAGAHSHGLHEGARGGVDGAHLATAAIDWCGRDERVPKARIDDEVDGPLVKGDRVNKRMRIAMRGED